MSLVAARWVTTVLWVTFWAWTSLSKMASIIKGVLNREEAVGSLAVARQPLQNYSMQASGVAVLESYKTCKGIYHHYHRMDLPLCVITGRLGDGEDEGKDITFLWRTAFRYKWCNRRYCVTSWFTRGGLIKPHMKVDCSMVVQRW